MLLLEKQVFMFVLCFIQEIYIHRLLLDARFKSFIINLTSWYAFPPSGHAYQASFAMPLYALTDLFPQPVYAYRPSNLLFIRLGLLSICYVAVSTELR